MAVFGSANNIKHDEMEDTFVNFVLAMASRYAEFTELTTEKLNMSTQLRYQEDQIQLLQADLCNLKVASET